MGEQTQDAARARVRSRRTFSLLVVVILAAHSISLHAESEDERRVKAGARLFRAMLSADVDIDKKSHDGALTILIVRSERSSFEGLAQEIITPPDEEGASIRDLPLQSRVIGVEELGTDVASRCAGLFLAGRLSSSDLQSVIRYASEKRVIAFSPFEGDVEQGVSGGLSVEARVKPYVNGPALAKAGVQLKDKFMKVAKTFQ
jgi:hypothetical protein